MELIGRFHLNPEAHYPSVLLHYANLLPGVGLHRGETAGKLRTLERLRLG